jgi:hypothetical protein
MLHTHVLPAPERLEDRPARELVRAVPEHRPVRDFAGRRSTRPDRVQHAARRGRAELIEVRRRCGLEAGAAAEHIVRTIGEPVEQEDENGIQVRP